MIDIQILPKKSSSLLLPLLLSLSSLSGYNVYQKIFILFLTRSNLLFRLSNGSSLISKLLACNNYNQSLIDNIATIAKSLVLSCLTLTDRLLLRDLQILVTTSSINIKVTLIDDIIYLGAINVE